VKHSASVKSRLYLMRGEFLRQRLQKREWEPGLSGGNHAPQWPPEVEVFLAKALKAGYNYAFAASEAQRNLGFKTERSQVRHWAIRNGLVVPERAPRVPRPPPPMATPSDWGTLAAGCRHGTLVWQRRPRIPAARYD